MVARALSGDRRAMARVITWMENGGEAAWDAMMLLYPHTGRAHVVGITGAPGVGKSSLVNELARAFRRKGRRVGVVAVDPTSPFSGGALLGDRLRMRDVGVDRNVFIRSMASRGGLGGLAPATFNVARVLDACGYDVVIVETVGAGQNEVDIARMADTTVVLQMPSTGDEIQAMKAGVLEVADILVVNKADLPGAESAVSALESMLDAGEDRQQGHHGSLATSLHESSAADEPASKWKVPVLKTCAVQGEGIDELVAVIEAHREEQVSSGRYLLRQRDRARDELTSLLRDMLFNDLIGRLPEAVVNDAISMISSRKLDPHAAALRLMEIATTAVVREGAPEMPCGCC